MSDIKALIVERKVVGRVEDVTLKAVMQGANISITMQGAGKISAGFAADDYAGGSKIIGSIPAGKVIQTTVVAISEDFDSGYVTVGTQGAQGILVATGDAANSAGAYVVDNHLATEDAEVYKIFFHGGPAAGAGSVIIYFI